MKKSRFTDSQIITVLKQAEAGTERFRACAASTAPAMPRLQMASQQAAWMPSLMAA